MRKDLVLAACHRVAARQHGAISRAQALRCGMSRRMIERALEHQLWRTLYPSTYFVGNDEPVWLTKQAGAVLAGGFQCVASHRAAGRLLGLNGCDSAVVEITSIRTIRWRGVVAHQHKTISSRDTTRIQNIRTTTAARTLLDLGSVVDLFRLEAALDSAIVGGLTSVDYVRRALQRSSGPGCRGVRPLRNLIEARMTGHAPSESELERLFERCVTRAHALPRPIAQFRVELGEGVLARLDFAYPTALLGIEVLGWRFHGGQQRWQKDLQRHNRLSDLGWTLLYFTWADVKDSPAKVAAQIRSVLASRENTLFAVEHPLGGQTRKG